MHDTLEKVDAEVGERQEKAATELIETLVEVDTEVGASQAEAVCELASTLKQAEVDEQSRESEKLAKLEGVVSQLQGQLEIALKVISQKDETIKSLSSAEPAHAMSLEQTKRREMFGDPNEFRDRSESALPPHMRTSVPIADVKKAEREAKRREMFGDPEEYRERSQSALPPHLRTKPDTPGQQRMNDAWNDMLSNVSKC